MAFFRAIQHAELALSRAHAVHRHRRVARCWFEGAWMRLSRRNLAVAASAMLAAVILVACSARDADEDLGRQASAIYDDGGEAGDAGEPEGNRVGSI
jgi:hypothetical protein